MNSFEFSACHNSSNFTIEKITIKRKKQKKKKTNEKKRKENTNDK